MNIYCLNDSELFSEECFNKGFRDDIFVFINDVYYKLSIYDRCRIMQDFDTEIYQNGAFVPEPNMLIVPNLSNENIIKTICATYNEGLFDYFSPCILDSNNIFYIRSSAQMKLYDEMSIPYKIKIKELLNLT